MDKSAKMTYAMIEVAIDKGIRDIQDNTHRGIRNLIDLGSHCLLVRFFRIFSEWLWRHLDDPHPRGLGQNPFAERNDYAVGPRDVFDDEQGHRDGEAPEPSAKGSAFELRQTGPQMFSNNSFKWFRCCDAFHVHVLLMQGFLQRDSALSQ